MQNLPGLRFVYNVIYTWSTLGLHLRPPIRLHLTCAMHIHVNTCTWNVKRKRILWVQLVKCTCIIHVQFMPPCHNLYLNVFEVNTPLGHFSIKNMNWIHNMHLNFQTHVPNWIDNKYWNTSNTINKLNMHFAWTTLIECWMRNFKFDSQPGTISNTIYGINS